MTGVRVHLVADLSRDDSHRARVPHRNPRAGWEHDDVDHDRLDRCVIFGLGTDLPESTVVIVRVEGREFITRSAARLLHDLADRVSVIVEAPDRQIAQQWEAAIATGDPTGWGHVA